MRLVAQVLLMTRRGQTPMTKLTVVAVLPPMFNVATRAVPST